MSSANLEATSVTAIAENASSDNYGLYNYGAAAATLNGGSFTGRGGTNACCIRNRRLSTARLEATAVAALGEEGASNNCGFCNTSNARATMYGGSFTAPGTGSSSAHGLGVIERDKRRFTAQEMLLRPGFDLHPGDVTARGSPWNVA
jgi:hypothetical protein